MALSTAGDNCKNSWKLRWKPALRAVSRDVQWRKFTDSGSNSLRGTPTSYPDDDDDDDDNDTLVCCRMTGGELFDYLASREKVDEATATMFLRQVLEGLRHLHQRNIVHLDLKVSESLTWLRLFDTDYVWIWPSFWWHCSGVAVRHWTCNQQVMCLTPTGTKLRNSHGRVVHTYVPLSPTGITWYWSKDGDVLWLGRWPQAAYHPGMTSKVTCRLTACTPGSALGPTFDN